MLTLGDIGTSPYWSPALRFGAGDVCLRRYYDRLQVVNLACTGYQPLYCQTLFLNSALRPVANKDLTINAYDATLIATLNKTNKSLDISRIGNVTPYNDGAGILGSNSIRLNSIYLKAGSGGVDFDTYDYLDYDATNDRFLFKIAGAVKGYLDTTGFHDGAP